MKEPCDRDEWLGSPAGRPMLELLVATAFMPICPSRDPEFHEDFETDNSSCHEECLEDSNHDSDSDENGINMGCAAENQRESEPRFRPQNPGTFSWSQCFVLRTQMSY